MTRTNRRLGLWLGLALPFLFHCGDDDGGDDAGMTDSGMTDGGMDTGPGDTGPGDAGDDTGPGDAGDDTGPGDAGDDAGPSEPDGVVFDDEYGANVMFAPFGGSTNAVEPTTDQAMVGTSSLGIAVPASGYTGGSLVLDGVTRDLTSFNAITFYARTDVGTHMLDVAGLGDDTVGNTDFKTEIEGDLEIDTEWAQFTIPIPNPAKLGAAVALFHFAEGTEGAYTIYLDEIRYVDLADGVVTDPVPAMATETVERPATDTYNVAGTVVSYMVDGAALALNPAGRAFFDFTSADEAVATVDDVGTVTAVAVGETTITATLAGVAVAGTLTFRVLPPAGPTVPAPTPPARAAGDVIAIFSNAYPDSLATVDTFRTDWSQPAGGTVVMTDIDGDDVLRYPGVRFAGITTEAMQVDASMMTHVHIDIWVEGDPLTAPEGQVFTLKLVDFGADGTFAGGDDSDAELLYTPSGVPSGTLTGIGSWQSFDIPLADFDIAGAPEVGGLTSREHLAQYLVKSELPGGGLTNLWVDNFYFYR